jgi:hypothetical protein
MIGRFIKHQLFAVIAGPVLALFWVLVVELFDEILRPRTGGIYGNVVEWLICISPVAAGYLLPTNAAEDRQVARWTWILPAIVLSLLFAWEAADFGLRTAVLAFFMATPSGGEGLATIIFTFPVVSSIAYSVGATISLALSRRRTHIADS